MESEIMLQTGACGWKLEKMIGQHFRFLNMEKKMNEAGLFVS